MQEKSKKKLCKKENHRATSGKMASAVGRSSPANTHTHYSDGKGSKIALQKNKKQNKSRPVTVRPCKSGVSRNVPTF